LTWIFQIFIKIESLMQTPISGSSQDPHETSVPSAGEITPDPRDISGSRKKNKKRLATPKKRRKKTTKKIQKNVKTSMSTARRNGRKIQCKDFGAIIVYGTCFPMDPFV
jgi:hypothetical protein